MTWLRLGTVLGAAVIGLGACSGDQGASHDLPADTGSDGAGAGPEGPSSSVGPGYGTSASAGTGYGYGAGGGSAGEHQPPPPPPPAGEGGGGGDAFSCELLEKEPLVLYVSADDSNSMGSPVQARELLRQGAAPHPNAIRTYEFLNYYRIGYPAPPPGELAILPELGATAAAGEFDLQIGVRAFDAPAARRPMTVTFVIDTSGSMSGPGIERARAVVRAVAGSLAKGDFVSAVTWDTSNNIRLSGHLVTGPNDPKLLSLADGLEADGATDLHSGLVAGYALAKKHYGEHRMNRVVLISDGGANVGVTDEEIIAEHSEDADVEGIYLVGVGTGPADWYNDLLMDQVTDKGRGAYVYIDAPEEAAAMFGARFDETMEVAARGVQLELTLPWYFKIEKFYGEEYSENPEEIEPQHLAPGDAMVFSQVLRACDPAEVVQTDPVTIRARWETPLTYQKKEVTFTATVGDLLGASKPTLDKGKAIVAYAEALKSPTPESLKAALETVNAANPGGDPELDEIASLIQAHPDF